MGSLFGLLLKIFSIISKFLFLILIVPNFETGVFSKYYYYLTIVTIVSKFISWGAEENLAILLNKFSNILRNQALFYVLMLTVISSLIVVVLYNYDWIYLSLTICALLLVLSSVSCGLVRRDYPSLFEVLINLPWLIFFAISWCWDTKDISDLFFNLSISQSISIIFVLTYFLLKQERIEFSYKSDISSLIKLHYKTGFRKLLTNILYVPSYRAIIFIPQKIGLNYNYDLLAMSLSVIEALWQFFVVLINRRFSKNLNGKKINIINESLDCLVVFISSGCVVVFLYFMKDLFKSLTNVSIDDAIYFLPLLWGMLLFTRLKFIIWLGGVKPYDIYVILFMLLVAILVSLLMFYFGAKLYFFSVFGSVYFITVLMFLYLVLINDIHNISIRK
ncbi:hypothetical protein [Photobacterium damselae]|uniref:hypothetical protein n=1 Tax=Photobacterium damselae TaxID=38293 RepID=UPI0018A4063B|nr:hypothetical protein [Photobacterium damselae]QOQ69296.1 hypothetical protein IL982_03045 [Photobacterium damselae subsp. damselae]